MPNQENMVDVELQQDSSQPWTAGRVASGVWGRVEDNEDIKANTTDRLKLLKKEDF